ncbi:hypothetical protein ACH5RR_009132 [Cinchona calisaya]|uniref:Uncharacterized protein n=1 Tax=Cinchona calisaya TaxID=153742 RepID=A0ABD3AGV8_9GENT
MNLKYSLLSKFLSYYVSVKNLGGEYFTPTTYKPFYYSYVQEVLLNGYTSSFAVLCSPTFLLRYSLSFVLFLSHYHSSVSTYLARNFFQLKLFSPIIKVK